MKCCICNTKIIGYGNNPYPLCKADDYESRCCDMCDAYVVKARIALTYGNKKMLDEVIDVVKRLKKG